MSESNGFRPKLNDHLVILQIMDDKRLSPVERTLALKTLRHRDPLTGACFPGQRELASYVSMSQPGVRKAMERLQDKGVIFMAHGQQWEKYGHGTNQYFFLADIHLFHTLIGVPDHVMDAYETILNHVKW